MCLNQCDLLSKWIDLNRYFETVQVLTQEYYKDFLFPLSKSEALEKMCSKHKQ